MELFIWAVIFILSIGVLVKSSDIFSDSAEKIGLALKIPSFIIGVTIVSIGTSLPELISSIIAVMEGNTELVAANVIGSNITNIFLVLGIAAIVAGKLTVTYDLIHIDLPLLVGSSLLFGVTALDGSISMYEGILLTLGSIIYISYTVNTNLRRDKKEQKEDKQIEKALKEEHNSSKFQIKPLQIIIMLLSLVIVFISANFTVDSILAISEILDVGAEIIGISIVSLGTSLPELFVTFDLARKGKSEMVVGNILGSNIFNAFAVAGIPAIIAGELEVPPTLIFLGLPMLFIAAILYFFTTQEKQLTKWEGGVLILFYLFFLGEIIGSL